MRAGQRDLDIVLYGTTGSIGRLDRRIPREGRAEVPHRVGRPLAANGCTLSASTPGHARDWPLIVADTRRAGSTAPVAADARWWSVLSGRMPAGPSDRRGMRCRRYRLYRPDR